MVIAEIVQHPYFELVGVGVSNPAKVGRDVGEICSLRCAIGLTATDDIDALIALRPDALVHYGPTAAHADDEHRADHPVPAGRHRCQLHGDDTVGVAEDASRTPPNWIQPITDACEAGGASCFTTGIDPGFANDLVPADADGPVLRGQAGAGLRAARLHRTTPATTKYEMGIGRPPRVPAAAGNAGDPRSWPGAPRFR